MFTALILLAGLLFSTMAAVFPTSTDKTSVSIHKRTLKLWIPRNTTGMSNGSQTHSFCDLNSINYRFDQNNPGNDVLMQDLDCQTLLSDKNQTHGHFEINGGFGEIFTGQDWLPSADTLWGEITCNIAAHVNTSDQVL